MDLSPISSLTSHWPTDWIIIAALVVFITFDAYRSGSGRSSALALAFPLALLLVNALLSAFLIGSLTAQLASVPVQAVIFVVALVALFALMYRITALYSAGAEIIPALLCGIAATAIVITVWLQVPALQSLYHFSPQVQTVFGESYRFWWLLASYFMLAVARS